jgi:hypothetical protein
MHTKNQGMAYANFTQIDTKQHFDVGKVFMLWACPCGSGYLLQVLAALRAFRSYPSRIHHHRFIQLPVVSRTANNLFIFTGQQPSQASADDGYVLAAF